MEMCDPKDCDCPFSDPNDCIQHMKPDGIKVFLQFFNLYLYTLSFTQIPQSYIVNLAVDQDVKLDMELNPNLASWEKSHVYSAKLQVITIFLQNTYMYSHR